MRLSRNLDVRAACLEMRPVGAPGFCLAGLVKEPPEQGFYG
jgi:hypothetical protein